MVPLVWMEQVYSRNTGSTGPFIFRNQNSSAGSQIIAMILCKGKQSIYYSPDTATVFACTNPARLHHCPLRRKHSILILQTGKRKFRSAA